MATQFVATKYSKACQCLRCLLTTQRIKNQYRCLSELDRLMLGSASGSVMLRFLIRLALDIDGRYSKPVLPCTALAPPSSSARLGILTLK